MDLSTDTMRVMDRNIRNGLGSSTWTYASFREQECAKAWVATDSTSSMDAMMDVQQTLWKWKDWHKPQKIECVILLHPIKHIFKESNSITDFFIFFSTAQDQVTKLHTSIFMQLSYCDQNERESKHGQHCSFWFSQSMNDPKRGKRW